MVSGIQHNEWPTTRSFKSGCFCFKSSPFRAESQWEVLVLYRLIEAEVVATSYVSSWCNTNAERLILLCVSFSWPQTSGFSYNMTNQSSTRMTVRHFRFKTSWVHWWIWIHLAVPISEDEGIPGRSIVCRSNWFAIGCRVISRQGSFTGGESDRSHFVSLPHPISVSSHVAGYYI